MSRYISFCILFSIAIVLLIFSFCGENGGTPDNNLCVWIADEYNNVVRCFSIDGSKEFSSPVLPLNDPRSVSIDERNGLVWIADRYNGRILKIDRSGNILYTSDFYKYKRVNWVACDSSNGNCWGCARDDGFVVKLDENGNEIGRAVNMGFPFFCVLETDGKCWASDEKNGKVYLLPSDFTGEVDANNIALLKIDVAGVGFISPDGNGGIFCVHEDTSELTHYDKSGNQLCRIYGFNALTCLWYDIAAKRLYAGDGGTLRLLKGDLSGDFKVADAQIAMLFGFGSIDYMQVSGYDGTLWVADKGRDSVHIIKGDISERIREINGFHDPFGISIRDEVK